MTLKNQPAELTKAYWESAWEDLPMTAGHEAGSLQGELGTEPQLKAKIAWILDEGNNT